MALNARAICKTMATGQGGIARVHLMSRLAVPIVIGLLLLFAGAVWALFAYMDIPPEMAGRPAQEQKQEQSPAITRAQPPAAAGDPQASRSEPDAPAPSATASFDVARIDPEGISVFAGRAVPGTNVMILGDGEPLGTVLADENGEWTFTTEHRFASNDPELGVRTATAAEMRQAEAQKAQAAAGAQQGEDAQRPKRSAKAVTSDLLKNLEGMVASARSEQESREETTEAAQKPDEPKPSRPAERPEEPEIPVGRATSLPATETVPDRFAAARLVPEPQPEPNRAERKTVPVPITFIFNEATLTADGEKAAALLLEYLRLKNFGRVALTGHADERGTVELNMNLSRQRLETVARYLKDGGFTGALELIPKGESEPFTGVVRGEYEQEDLYQLDRRVELIIER